jgi:DNA-binding NarL/FixJ family response regulator
MGMDVVLIARDPLVRGSLRERLQGMAPLALREVETPERVGTSPSAEATLWDLGPEEAKPTEVSMWAERLAPLLLLASPPFDGRQLLSLGARGVLDREVTPGPLRAALQAVAEGLWVLDDFQSTSFEGAESPLAIEALTPREQEVLRLLARGLSNKEIARTLAITEHTAKFHVNAVLQKLGVGGRTEAVVKAVRMGLVAL